MQFEGSVPTIRDRVVQMAAVLILEPIFEADLQAEQHAYRARHSAQEAVKEVHGWLKKGLREVVDADLSGYFDTIPHAPAPEEPGASHQRWSDVRIAQKVATNACRRKRWTRGKATE